MSNIRSLGPGKSDVKETLQQIIEIEDKLACCMVLGITKDGNPLVASSTCSAVEKTFLVAFVNAWIAKWFGITDADV